METYVTGKIIKKLRENKKYTQRQLADILFVSEKTISKWETEKGIPDISLIEPLAKALDISITELFNGEVVNNHNQAANMLKSNIYVCPVCGNVIISIGNGVFSCCGMVLISQEAEISTSLNIEDIDAELYVSLNNAMTKTDYISFFAYLTSDKIQMTKLYPEQDCEARFSRRGHGLIYYYSNKDGLFMVRL